MKQLILISAFLLTITGCASNPPSPSSQSSYNSPEFKKYEEFLYRKDPYQQASGTSYILTVKSKRWKCRASPGVLGVWCNTTADKLNKFASAICQLENSGDYVGFTSSRISLKTDARFKCFKDENKYQAWNESQRRIKEDREEAARLAYQQKIERQKAAKEARRLEAIARENAILESKKEKCRSYGFKENTDGFGLCMLEQDRIAAQAQKEAEERRRREAQAFINAGAAILNRNRANCSFSCPGGQVVQGSCSTSSINVNGKICFKR